MSLDIEIQLQQDGYCILEAVFSSDEVVAIQNSIDHATQNDADSALSSRGTIFAARNLIDSIPDLVDVANSPKTRRLLGETLGENFGLVRALYFDKPSNRSWNLPFHKDLTIAVKDNSLPIQQVYPFLCL